MFRKKGKNKKRVLVGGCFNFIHPGHLWFLKEAKSLSNELIVVLAHDKNNPKIHAKPAKERRKLVESLGIADKILIGDPIDTTKVVKSEKPDLIVLGYDQSLPTGMEQLANDLGIKIKRLKKFGEYASSSPRVL